MKTDITKFKEALLDRLREKDREEINKATQDMFLCGVGMKKISIENGKLEIKHIPLKEWMKE